MIININHLRQATPKSQNAKKPIQTLDSCAYGTMSRDKLGFTALCYPGTYNHLP